MINKICFTASSGGHLEEISRLKELEKKYDSFLFTEENHFCELEFCKKVYYTKQIRRHEFWFPIRYLVLFVKSLIILLKEKPDCIISTGALVTYPLCVLGKMLGKKIIYIESFARVNQISTTGRWMKRIADLFLVQSEELIELMPKAVYGGSLFCEDDVQQMAGEEEQNESGNGMIFVVLGTQKFQLTRLLKVLDNYVAKGLLTQRIVAQTGFTPYKPKHYEFHRFFDKKQYDEMMRKADLIICHGGVGTIITANRMGKPIIVYPRLAQYKEHIDDHQLEVAKVFAEKNYVLCCRKEDDLLKVIEKSKTFQFQKYWPKSQNMIKIITNFLERP